MCADRQKSLKMENVDSCEEDILIDELRSAIADIIEKAPLFSEYFYLRLWLKAKKMKVKEAEKAIRNSWKWRKENDLIDVDRVPSEVDLDFFEFLPADITGHDKQGLPVLQMPIGLWKASACVSKFGREDFIRYMSLSFTRGELDVQEYHERLRENADSAAQQTLKTRGIIGIMNFSHFSLRNCASLAAIQAGLECTNIFGNYYCGHIERMIFINVNSIVSAVLKPFLPLLSGVPIEIYGTDAKSWKPKLYSLIDPSQLLPGYGGTKRQQTLQDLLDYKTAKSKRIIC